MKSIMKFLFFIIIFFTSCIDREESNKIEKLTKKYERNITIENPLVMKIRLYSYITGKVLVKNNLVRDLFRNVATSNNNIINLNEELQIEFMKTFFLSEASNIRSILRFNLGFDDSPMLRGDPALGITEDLDPPIGDLVNNPSEQYNQWVYQLSVIENIINELQTSVYGDCLEIYIKRPFTKRKYFYNSSIISELYVVPHPINNINSASAYLFTFNSLSREEGIILTINNEFLSFHPYDVIIVRPIRNSICSYSNVDIDDFTDFLEN